MIELLVVIVILATLVGLLAPGLSQARRSAKQILCLGNHRQLVTAWAAYTNDHAVFPYGSDASFQGKERFGWGGVNWFAATGSTPGLNISADRPLNPYVESDQRIEHRVNVFRCPLDIGAHLFNRGIRTWEEVAATGSSGEPATCYGLAGTSYEANVWMYCQPGSPDGWGSGQTAMTKHRSNQGPQHVVVSTSTFVVLKDIGPANWIVTPPAMRSFSDLWGEWWHGDEKESFAFLDGSARVEKSGLLVCPRYSMHMIPLRWPNSTWRWPYSP